MRKVTRFLAALVAIPVVMVEVPTCSGEDSGPVTQLGPNLAAGTPPMSQSLAEQDFDGSFPPAGWNVVNNGGDCVWESTATTLRPNRTGGANHAADADSNWCGDGTAMNTVLMSPMFDVSMASEIWLSFAYDFVAVSLDEIAAVDLSPNGGVMWTNIVTWTVTQPGPATFVADVTSVVGGSSQTQVRFRYLAQCWCGWLEIDDFRLLDQTFPPIFADGFESNDTSEWSATVT